MHSPYTPYAATNLRSMGRVLIQQGRCEEALEMVEQAAAIAAKVESKLVYGQAMLLRGHCKEEEQRRQGMVAAQNEADRTESAGSDSTGSSGRADFKVALKVATEVGDKVGEVHAGTALLLSTVGVASTIGTILYDPQGWASSLSSDTQFRRDECEQQQEQLQNWLRISRHELVDPQLEAHTLICMGDWRLRLWHTRAKPSRLNLAQALHCFGRALKLAATIQTTGAYGHPLLLAKAMLRGVSTLRALHDCMNRHGKKGRTARRTPGIAVLDLRLNVGVNGCVDAQVAVVDTPSANSVPVAQHHPADAEVECIVQKLAGGWLIMAQPEDEKARSRSPVKKCGTDAADADAACSVLRRLLRAGTNEVSEEVSEEHRLAQVVECAASSIAPEALELLLKLVASLSRSAGVAVAADAEMAWKGLIVHDATTAEGV
jgi:hypothetical protein